MKYLLTILLVSCTLLARTQKSHETQPIYVNQHVFGLSYIYQKLKIRFENLQPILAQKHFSIK